MRRLIGAAVIAAGAVVAVTAVPPPDRIEPVFADVVGGAAEAGAGTSIWYCTVAEATAETNGLVGLVTLTSQVASLTLPSPFPGDEPSGAEFALDGPAALDISIAEVVLRGQSPGLVEFPTGPAAASVVSSGSGGVFGDLCVASAPKEWYLPGGTTRSGATMILRLFNPFPEDAKVTVTGTSELGSVPLPDFDALDVPARSWINLDFTTEVPFLDELALKVRSDSGLVMPSVILDYGGDAATWPGTGLSTTWEFPSVGAAGLDPVLIVANANDAAAEVTVDVFTPTGPILAAASFTAQPSNPLRIEVADFADGPIGVRLNASSPVAAVVVGASTIEGVVVEGEPPPDPVPGDLAATAGVVAPAGRWLVSGLTGADDASLWILNSGGDDATVILLPLATESGEPAKISVAAGSIKSVPILSAGDAGFLVESSTAISVGWVAEGPGGVAYLGAAAIEDAVDG